MKQITIYSTPSCPYCIKAKEWLNEKKIEYTDVDVSTDDQAREYIQSKTGALSVPQFKIGQDQFIVGFDKEKLEEAINE